MSEQVKPTQITQSELQEISTIKSQANSITFALGENLLKREMLLNQHKELLRQEQEFVSKLVIKYGDGSVDTKTGIITYE